MNVAGLSGKRAFVTGAASGIGAATAILLARNGARLCLVDRDAAGLADTAQRAAAAGGRAITVTADVASASGVRQAVETAVGELGPLDVCVNVAGVSGRSPLIEMTDDEWERVVRVNLNGTFYVCREVGRRMAARGSGSIVNVSSTRAVVGLANGAHYAASKAGVVALTYSLAEELRGSGVRVNVVLPGATDTPLFRSMHSAAARDQQRGGPGGVASAEAVARLIVFVASDDGEPLTGQALGWVHRYS